MLKRRSAPSNLGRGQGEREPKVFTNLDVCRARALHLFGRDLTRVEEVFDPIVPLLFRDMPVVILVEEIEDLSDRLPKSRRMVRGGGWGYVEVRSVRNEYRYLTLGWTHEPR